MEIARNRPVCKDETGPPSPSDGPASSTFATALRYSPLLPATPRYSQLVAS